MKFFLISSNNDTTIGLRLAGIDGVIVRDEEEARAALERTVADESVGVVLMTERLSSMCAERVYDLKQNSTRPLIVEIPDRHGNGRASDSITRYVREAVGIKI